MKLRVLLLAVALFACVGMARATTITITVGGTLSQGTDSSGMWGFAPNTSMAGQNFALVFTCNDTVYGQEQLNGDPSYIWSAYTSSSPCTALLTINDIGYTIGSGSGPSSEAIIYTGGPNPSGSGVNHGTFTYEASDGTSSVVTSGSPSGLDTYMSGTWETTIPLEAITAGGNNSFNISNGSSYSSSGDFSANYVQVSGGPSGCSVSAELDTTNYPNILQNGDTTTIAATISPTATGDTVYFYSNNGYGSIYPPSSTTNSSGEATDTYKGGSSSSANLDTFTAYACGGAAPAVNVFDYNVSNFDIHQSHVTDSTFTNTTFSASSMQSWLATQGSFLATFYVDTANPVNTGAIGSGWLDGGGGGIFDATLDTPYCPSAGQCPIDGDVGLSAANAIYQAATASTNALSINPKLLLAEMQKEQGMISHSFSYENSYGLNNALGCNATTYPNFLVQLGCGATTLANLYNNATPLTYPYFFPTGGTYDQQIKLAYSASCNNDGPLVSGCAYVGFSMNNAATKSQFNYTPFVQDSTTGGGVRLFESIWYSYGW